MIFPSDDGTELDDTGIAAAYAYPADRAWLRANFVASADGAGHLNGRSAGLSSPGDMRIFGILRVLADVILVGAGTARAEEYKAARYRPELAELRAGRPPVATIAVVTRSVNLDLAAPLFTEAPADARTIVITSAAAPADRRAEAAKVADVIVAGETDVDLTAAVAGLHERDLSRVNCEGGPHLLRDLATAGLLDELCLSLSPMLTGPGAGRITAGQPFHARPMTLAGLLVEDSFLYCRYLAGAS
jgi:riboflavin biosynthesis pyrimidine reductase